MKNVIFLILISLFFSTISGDYSAFAVTKKKTPKKTVQKESVEVVSDTVNGTIYFSGEFLDGDILKLSVLSKDLVVPTLGVAFHLLYEGEKVSFLRYEPGDFLELGGNPFYLVKNDLQNSEIVFGETLRKDDDFPLNGGVIAEFYFQITSSDVFDFKFKNGIVSSLNTVRQDVDKIIFEDIVLDKNEPNLGLTETNSPEPTNQSFIEKYLNSSFLSTFVLIILATFSSLFLIKLIKKISKNKPTFTYSSLK